MSTAVRGVRPLSPGDLTGKVARERAAEAEANSGICASTADFIRAGHEVKIIPTPGGRTWAIPTELLNWLTSSTYREKTQRAKVNGKL